MPQNPHVSLIMQSGIFDAPYYSNQLHDNKVMPANAIEHYLAIGAGLGLNPHPLFNSGFYLQTYPDVASAGMNPLVHYILHGAREGRFPNQYFDSEFYLASLPESERAGVNPLTHYLRASNIEKRATHPQFDTQLYFTFYPEALIAGCDPLAHYLQKGAEQKRLAHIEFDPQFYLDTYKDVAAAGLDPVQHYNLYGRAEGRLPRSAKQRFQNLKSFENILHALLHSDSIKRAASAALASNIAVQRDQSEKSTPMPMRVYWGCHLFERRLLDQFLEVARRLSEAVFIIHKEFLPDAVELPANVQVLDIVVNMVSSEQQALAGGFVFISPVESSPVSELMLRAIESGILVVCSDECELSKVISPSESSMLPEGISAEKIVHAITYASANRQSSACRAMAGRARLIALKN
jgi:hypothetical protein